MNAPGASIGEPDVDRWQPVEREERQEADEVAPPVAGDEATPPPAATRSATPPPTPAPAADTSTATSATATVTPAGHMLIGGASVATLGGLGLYNTVGAMGLAVGGATAVAGAGGYAYWRYRRWRNGRNGGGGNRRTSSSGGGSGKSTFPSTTRAGRTAAFSTRPSPATRSSSGGGSGRGATGTPFRSGGRSGATGSAATKRHMKFPGTGSGGGGGRGGATGRNATNTKGGGGSATSRRHPATATHRYTTPARATATRAARALRRAAATRVKRIRATSRHHTTRLPHAARQAARRVRHLITRLQQADTRLTATLAEVAGDWWRNRRATATDTTDGATDTDTEAASATATKATTATATEAADTATGVLQRPPHPRTNLPTRPSTHQGASMAFGLITHATELPTIAAGYESDDMMDVKGHLDMLHELPLQAASAIRVLTERLAADYPIDHQVIEAMQQVYEALLAAAAPAEEVGVIFSTVHADDINRHLQPRTNERLWNV